MQAVSLVPQENQGPMEGCLRKRSKDVVDCLDREDRRALDGMGSPKFGVGTCRASNRIQR